MQQLQFIFDLHPSDLENPLNLPKASSSMQILSDFDRLLAVMACSQLAAINKPQQALAEVL